MKRWIAVLLSFVMVLSLMPMAVMAEEAVEGPPITALYVGTVNALETPSGDGWSFNRETGVLTLNNCTLTESMLHVETDEYGSDRFDAMIYVKGDLTIELIGTNSVERVIEEAPTVETSYYAICNSIYYSGDYDRPGSLTFTGSGNLTVGIAVTRDCLSEDEWNMNEAWEHFQFSSGIGSWSYTDLSGLYGGGWIDIYGGIYGVEGPYNVRAFANYPTFGDNCIVTAYQDVEGTVENENGYNWNNNDAWRMKVVTADAYLKSNGQLILLDKGSASGEGWTWENSVLTLSADTVVKAVEFRKTVGSAKVTLAGDVTLDATDMGYDANWNSISAVTAYCDLEIDAGDHILTLHNSWADALRAELCDVTISGGTVVTTNEGGYAINMIGGDLTIQNATFRSATEIYLTEGYDADYNTIPAGDAVLSGAVVVLDSPITSYGTLTVLSSDVTVTWGYDALYGNTAVTVRDSTLSIDASGHALTSNSVVTVDNCNLNLTAEEAVIYHGYYHYEGDDESNIPDTTRILLQNMDITQPEGCSVQVKQTDSDYYTKYEVLVVDGDGNPATTLVATAAGNEHEHSYENGICSCGAKQTFTVIWTNWDGTVLETDTVEYGTVPTYDGETPTRPNVGYDFKFYGWALSASGAGVTPGAVTKDVTYYAKYTSTIHNHALIFLDDDGVTELGRYETYYSKGISGSWLTTAAGNPTKEGYTLTGWTYADGSAVESYFYMPDNDVIFVAVWEPTQYTLHFDANEGSFEPYSAVPQKDSIYTIGDTVALPKAYRTGYTLTGYKFYTDSACSVEYTGSTGTMPAQELWAVAQWEINFYGITFYPEGGIFADGTTGFMYGKYEYNTPFMDQLPEISRDCYTFQGWKLYTTAAKDFAYTGSTEAMPARELHAVAQWSGPNHMDVSTDADHSCDTCGAENVTEHSYEAEVTAPTCTEGGYTTYTCNCGDSYVADEVAALGHNYEAAVTAPTCTEGGYTTFTCHCGDSYVADETTATGHSYSEQRTEASCTEPGLIEYTCANCGDVYTEEIPATGHSYMDVQTPPTCTEAGYTTHTCHCGDSYVDNTVAALGHNQTTQTVYPTCTEEGSVTVSCDRCGEVVVGTVPATGHSYENGTCTACGAIDPDYSPAVVIPTLTLKAPTLEFKDMITVNAMFTAENIDDVVEMGMITYTEKVDQWSVETAKHVIPGTTYDVNTGRYIAASQGIHAKYLGDTVYLACYAKLTDGSYVYTKLAGYSPVQYATSKLKGTDVELKQLVVAMLNYGAAAQTHFNHNVDNLANASLTEEQLALPEAYRSDMVSTVASPSAQKQGAFANNSGFAKKFPSISFEGAFCINYFFTPNYAPVDGITLYYWNAADYEAAQTLTVENASGSLKLEGEGTAEYRGDITGIAAKSLSEAVYVAAVYSDGTTTWTSGVLGYSIGAYCSSMAKGTDAMADLAMATAVYGYHAKQYFGS